MKWCWCGLCVWFPRECYYLALPRDFHWVWIGIYRQRERVSIPYKEFFFLRLGDFIVFLVSNSSYSLSIYQCFFCFHSSSYSAVEFSFFSAVSLHVCVNMYGKERNKSMRKQETKLHSGSGRACRKSKRDHGNFVKTLRHKASKLSFCFPLFF